MKRQKDTQKTSKTFFKKYGQKQKGKQGETRNKENEDNVVLFDSKKEENMARNEYQFIVIKRSKIVFIGTAVECAAIVRIKSAGYIHQYAKRFHSYNGYYFVKLPSGIKNKEEDEIHGGIYSSAASARAHMRIAQQRLESAIAERDNFTVEIIDMYLSLMLKRDRIKEFMERRGYKIHEYD